MKQTQPDLHSDCLIAKVLPYSKSFTNIITRRKPIVKSVTCMDITMALKLLLNPIPLFIGTQCIVCSKVNQKE